MWRLGWVLGTGHGHEGEQWGIVCPTQHTRARYIPREKEEEQSGDEGEGRHFSVTEEEEQQPPPEGSSLLAAYKFATSEWIRAQLAVGHCPKRKEGIFEKRMRVD